MPRGELYTSQTSADIQKDFLRQTGEWKETLSQLVAEMIQEHKKLSEALIKDFSTAVISLRTGRNNTEERFSGRTID